jgi:hypothetical protein
MEFPKSAFGNKNDAQLGNLKKSASTRANRKEPNLKPIKNKKELGSNLKDAK